MSIPDRHDVDGELSLELSDIGSSTATSAPRTRKLQDRRLQERPPDWHNWYLYRRIIRDPRLSDQAKVLWHYYRDSMQADSTIWGRDADHREIAKRLRWNKDSVSARNAELCAMGYLRVERRGHNHENFYTLLDGFGNPVPKNRSLRGQGQLPFPPQIAPVPHIGDTKPNRAVPHKGDGASLSAVSAVPHVGDTQGTVSGVITGKGISPVKKELWKIQGELDRTREEIKRVKGKLENKPGDDYLKGRLRSLRAIERQSEVEMDAHATVPASSRQATG